MKRKYGFRDNFHRRFTMRTGRQRNSASNTNLRSGFSTMLGAIVQGHLRSRFLSNFWLLNHCLSIEKLSLGFPWRSSTLQKTKLIISQSSANLADKQTLLPKKKSKAKVSVFSITSQQEDHLHFRRTVGVPQIRRI